jgi:glycosyltransferase involved in cell wall biosynthesis
MANSEKTTARLPKEDERQAGAVIDCSVVVPLYNESDVVQELYDRLTKTLAPTGLYYELIFVDDGSSDNTPQLLKTIVAGDSKVVVVELRRNFGKSAAYAAGFDNAKGRIIITMDGDLQHLPEDIPRFVEKIEDGYDVVCSWRQRRVDNLVMRRIPSKAANWLASKISGVDIHDFGGGFKAYKREIIEELNLYGEMQRFIPAIVSQRGAKIVEIPIKNIPRPHGTSRYGISRMFWVAFDLVTLRFLLEYITRPLHFFGIAATNCLIASLLMMGYILFDKLYYNVPILVAHGPLAGLAAVLLLVGTIFIATGLIGEMISRVYFESTGRKIYSVRQIHRRQPLNSGVNR